MRTATNFRRSEGSGGEAHLHVRIRGRQRHSASQAGPVQVSARAPRPLKPDTALLQETIRQAQQGDAAAFEALYKLHSRRVYALCLRMVGDAAEAEDLTQEAFLQLFRKIHTFRGESAFSSWLHRLSVNIVLMRLRKKSLVQTSLEEIIEPDEEMGGLG